MNKNDSIEKTFEKLKDRFDIHETPEGHQRRFLDKLKAQPKRNNSPRWWKPLSVAASLLLLVATGIFMLRPSQTEVDGLASVSPEMEETQSFFTAVINEELETLKTFRTKDSEILVEDTLRRLNVLESEYDKLKIDLVDSGNDRRVISAMITNFQKRVEILQEVIKTLEEIETLKANSNETII